MKKNHNALIIEDHQIIIDAYKNAMTFFLSKEFPEVLPRGYSLGLNVSKLTK